MIPALAGMSFTVVAILAYTGRWDVLGGLVIVVGLSIWSAHR